MVKRLATSPHDQLGITDSACKNQSVMVSIQYGTFNSNILIRSMTIGKSRVARDPITMHTSWRSNSDITCVTREHCDVLSMQIDSDLVIYRTTLVRTFQVVTICRVDKSEALSVIPRGSWGDVDSRTDTQLNVLSTRRGFWGVRLPKSQQGSNRGFPLLRGKTEYARVLKSPTSDVPEVLDVVAARRLNYLATSIGAVCGKRRRRYKMPPKRTRTQRSGENSNTESTAQGSTCSTTAT
ncbi:hypothetical protein F511_16029 [Dorcoceras hygrometricum]|uniref:Uncharacterized protein n=1 Tax=Dorcoceras hygrometricum TaxID=472368 RepID=A0A2Z7BUN4_9LAMI|nr:hypothetical protein F511_16029 [Dorcoceras hygrometricum]